MLGPNSGEGSKTSRGLDVTDNTDDDHWWGLDNGGGLDDLSLVHLGTGEGVLSDNVGHTGLETEETGQVNRLGRVILGERLALSSVSGGSLLGKETVRSQSKGENL